MTEIKHISAGCHLKTYFGKTSLTGTKDSSPRLLQRCQQRVQARRSVRMPGMPTTAIAAIATVPKTSLPKNTPTLLVLTSLSSHQSYSQKQRQRLARSMKRGSRSASTSYQLISTADTLSCQAFAVYTASFLPDQSSASSTPYVPKSKMESQTHGVPWSRQSSSNQ